MNKLSVKIKLLIIAILLAILYQLLLIDNYGISLSESKQMLDLNGPSIEIPFNIAPATYNLKLKHVFNDLFIKEAFLNGRELHLDKKKIKKDIETDYFRIKSSLINNGPNILKIIFVGSYPKDIDVRLSNYTPLPREDLSYDLFILFKNYTKISFLIMLKILISTLIICLFFEVVWLYINRIQKIHQGVYIIRASLPSLIFFFLMETANLLPFNPYTIAISNFFFWVTFLLSFTITLIAILPYALRADKE